MVLKCQSILPDAHTCSGLREETAHIVCSQTVGKRISVGASGTAVPLITGAASAPMAESTFSHFQTGKIWRVLSTSDGRSVAQGQANVCMFRLGLLSPHSSPDQDMPGGGGGAQKDLGTCNAQRRTKMHNAFEPKYK